MEKKKLREGSLTAEAAVVLPLFFMACLTLALFMNALKIQTQKNIQLSSKARTLAIAAGCGAASGIGTQDGSAGDAMWIDLTASEKFKMPFPVFGLRDIRILCRARVYPWIGSENGVSGSKERHGDEKEETVYITDNREVYHTYADCTHLNLTVIETTLTGVKNMRNADGKKYKRCRGFPANYTDAVYVTPQGTYYYPSTDYGSLTRHVHIVNHSDYKDLKLCERCAARKRAG